MMMKIEPVAGSRKEREKQARQQDIMNAAAELFARKGFHDTTLEEIAHHAEFAKGTIYNYFSSKEDLFFGIINKMMDDAVRIGGDAITNCPGDTRQKLSAYVRVMIEFVGANRHLFRLIMREALRMDLEGQNTERLSQLHGHEHMMSTLVADLLETEIQKGTIKPFHPKQLAGILDSMLRFYSMDLFEKSSSPIAQQAEEIAELVINIFYDGITAKE